MSSSSHHIAWARRARIAWRAAVTATCTAALVLVGSTVANAAGLPAGPSSTQVTGVRPNATRLSFAIDDQVGANVDVGTGNLNIAANLLRLQGVHGKVPIGISYNSLDTATATGVGSLNGPYAGWTWNLDGAGSLSLASNGSTIDYTTGDGAVWPFTQSGGLYTAPAGLKAGLVHNANNTYTLLASQSQQSIVFDASGNPTQVTDKDGNTTSIAITSSTSWTVTGTAGPSAARVATMQFGPFTYQGYTYYQTTVGQQNGSSNRTSAVNQSSSGQPLYVHDAMGAKTTFTYNGAGLVSQVANPLGATTTFTYDSSNRVIEVDQTNTTAGSAGTSTTRLSYPSSTSTLVAGPDTSTALSVASVAHAAFTIDGNHMVTAETDAAGRQHAASYTTAGLDVASSTTGTGTGSGGSAAAVSTTYGYKSTVNSGLSPVSATGQSGNESTAGYTNTGAAQYSPSTSAADANTATGSMWTTYGYAGADQTSTTGNTAQNDQVINDSTAVTASVTRNTSDGTIATATAPGNGSNATVYSYTDHQLTQVTPVTGSSLGVKHYTYDAFGRLATQTDGAGNTTTYGYDNDDRLLTTSFSDSTPTVTNTYDGDGDLSKQVSGGGTITDTYDQLGQLTSTANSAFGGTIAFGYDAAGNQTSLTDTRGTTTEAYDAAGVLLSTTYPKGSGTATTYFQTNSNGERINTWLQANGGTNPSSYAGHVQDNYDAAGRISEVIASVGPASSPTTQMDVTYCYNLTNGAGGSCGTTSGSDSSKLQATYNKVTGQETAFTYDGMGRLTKVAESGGNNGNDTFAYTYDARGNRTKAVVTGTDPASQTLSFNAANQITSTGYSYDGAGNLTASPNGGYTYNAAEQMTTATTGGHSYTYTYAGAAQNAVLSETGNGTTYQLAYGRSDGNGNPEIEQFHVGSATAYVEQDPTSGLATMLHTSSDIAGLYVYNGVGNPVGLLTDFNTSAFQYSYDPYGVATLQQSSGGNGVGQNPYTFKSGLQDRATGFVKFGQRWYNPTTGTWTQEDTLDSPLNLTNGNRYAYAALDPVNNYDPTGGDCQSIEDALGDGAAVGGGVAVLVDGGAALYGALLGLIDGPETALTLLVAFGATYAQPAVTAGAVVGTVYVGAECTITLVNED